MERILSKTKGISRQKAGLLWNISKTLGPRTINRIYFHSCLIHNTTAYGKLQHKILPIKVQRRFLGEKKGTSGHLNGRNAEPDFFTFWHILTGGWAAGGADFEPLPPAAPYILWFMSRASPPPGPGEPKGKRRKLRTKIEM